MKKQASWTTQSSDSNESFEQLQPETRPKKGERFEYVAYSVAAESPKGNKPVEQEKLPQEESKVQTELSASDKPK